MMRMVSNRPIPSQSMKRFKKVHVLHKVYAFKPAEKAVVEINRKEEDIEVVPIEENDKQIEMVTSHTQTESVESETGTTVTRKKKTRKKVTETIENNEEKPENDG